MSTSPSRSGSSGTSGSALPTRPSAETLALRKRVETFIDAQYRIWKQQPRDKIGQLATPEVLEAVKKTSTAFHCNSSGGVDLFWVKKDMPLEALKHVEVDYWTDKAGPGPKHEQEELVAIHGVPRDVMETIRKTNDHELIATYIYPFIDFWNLVEHHILIWIACIFFSGTLCIVQPILVACESSKITRLFNDNYMFRIYRAGLTIQVFQAFLLGQFDMDGLVAICIVTIIVIIWEDLPLSTEDWIHCYGIPVVVQYGPFPEHVCILFPKQDPYRPYHTMSLAQDYIELDRWARLIIEVARKIVAAAPPPPEGHARQDYMVKLRQVIVEEAVQLGLYKGLEDSKRKLRAKDYAFRHHSMSSYHKASKAASDAVGGPDKSRLVREKAGIRAVEVRKKIAVRAVGKPGSPERIEWAIEVLDDLRRKIEGGRTTQLLACPRIIQHGTLGHASWLIHKVTENADLVNSASGSGSLATPTNEMEKAARNIMQDKAGFPKYTPNSQESSVQEVLKLLAKSTRSTKDYCLATCPHCQSMWFLSAAGNRALHECQSLRDWFLPLLFDDHKEQLELKAEADALVKLAEAENKGSEDPEDSDVLLQVTRVSHTGFLPWTAGDSIAEEDEWEETCVNKPPVGTESVKKTRVMTDPLAHRALDVRGRISSLCLRLEPIITTPQLLSLPVASSLFEDGQPIPMKDMQFITLENFVKDHSRDLIEAGADLECLTAIAQAKTIWLASITSLQGEDLTKFLVDEVIKFAAGRKAKTVEPKIPRSDIEAAYRERIATRTLRPYFFKWDTGVDERKKDADQSVASTSSSAISTAL